MDYLHFALTSTLLFLLLSFKRARLDEFKYSHVSTDQISTPICGLKSGLRSISRHAKRIKSEKTRVVAGGAIFLQVLLDDELYKFKSGLLSSETRHRQIVSFLTGLSVGTTQWYQADLNGITVRNL